VLAAVPVSTKAQSAGTVLDVPVDASVLKFCVTGVPALGMRTFVPGAAVAAVVVTPFAATFFVVAAGLLGRATADGMLIRGNELSRIKIAVAIANAGRRGVCECCFDNENTD
jgi:hypothetical protein